MGSKHHHSSDRAKPVSPWLHALKLLSLGAFLGVLWGFVQPRVLSLRAATKQRSNSKQHSYFSDTSSSSIRSSSSKTLVFELPSMATTPSSIPVPCTESVSIDRLYYINLPHHQKRRQFMESWLGNASINNLQIPYQRVEALRGHPNSTCVPSKSHPDRCRGIAGLLRTELHIFDTLNTTGHTLVVEDDHVVSNMSALMESIQQVPDDWQMIRWNCWHAWKIQKYTRVNDFVYAPNRDVFCENHRYREDSLEECYCGGTGAYLIRDTTIPTLRQLWTREPLDDIDCRLTVSPSVLTSYCVNIDGLVELMEFDGSEETGIPKVDVNGVVKEDFGKQKQPKKIEIDYKSPQVQEWKKLGWGVRQMRQELERLARIEAKAARQEAERLARIEAKKAKRAELAVAAAGNQEQATKTDEASKQESEPVTAGQNAAVKPVTEQQSTTTAGKKGDTVSTTSTANKSKKKSASAAANVNAENADETEPKAPWWVVPPPKS